MNGGVGISTIVLNSIAIKDVYLCSDLSATTHLQSGFTDRHIYEACIVM